MSLEGHSDTGIHFYKTWGLKISQAKTQIINAEIFELPMKYILGERKETLSPSFCPNFFAHLYITLLLVLHEKCCQTLSLVTL